MGSVVSIRADEKGTETIARVRTCGGNKERYHRKCLSSNGDVVVCILSSALERSLRVCSFSGRARTSSFSRVTLRAIPRGQIATAKRVDVELVVGEYSRKGTKHIDSTNMEQSSKTRAVELSLEAFRKSGFMARQLAGVLVCPGSHVAVRWWGMSSTSLSSSAAAPNDFVLRVVGVNDSDAISDTSSLTASIVDEHTIFEISRERRIREIDEADLLSHGEDVWIERMSRQIGGVQSAVRELVCALRRALSPHCQSTRGVLICGACGKSALARVAAETAKATCRGLSVHWLRTQHLARPFEGDSEAQLDLEIRTIMAKIPCVVIVDDVEGVASDRASPRTAPLSKRLCAQFSRALKYFWRRQMCVAVLATTSDMNLIDPEIRGQPGGFGSIVVVPALNRADREAVLKILTRSMPLVETGSEAVGDTTIAHVATLTAGFSGADLEKLCREATIRSLCRLQIEEADGDSNADRGPVAKIAASDFKDATRQVTPSSSITIEGRPTVRGESATATASTDQTALLPGCRFQSDLLRTTVLLPLLHPQKLSSLGVSPPKGILIYGPSGCGKTAIAKSLRIACRGRANFIGVSCPSLLSRVVGETERNVAALFRKARRIAPSVIFLDHIESLAPVRGSDSTSESTMDRLLSCLLVEMDGVVAQGAGGSGFDRNLSVIVVAATERREVLDPAILRPGRLEVHVQMTRPTEIERREIFAFYLEKLSIDLSEMTLADGSNNIDVRSVEKLLPPAYHALAKQAAEKCKEPRAISVVTHALAASASSFTGGDIEGLCRRAAVLAMRGDPTRARVCVRHIRAAWNRSM
eukprot:g732.t1